MASSDSLQRRHFLQKTTLGLLGIPLTGGAAAGVSSATPAAVPKTAAKTASTALEPLNRFPHMMQDWLVDQVRAAEARGNELRDGVKTKADAEAYVASVQDRIRQCFGPMPVKTPLNAKVTGTVEHDTYRIENIVFESRPGYLVTGNLYIPKGVKMPRPGVIGVCGHSLNGKAAEAYQSFAQGLCRLSYVCFIVDPVGQGERFQFLTNDSKSSLGGGVSEHIQMGNPQALVGEFIGSWFAWDAIRALDYLLTRKEVDPQHVGVTGNSGGGTQTTWLCGLEPRFTMAAPACFVTTFRRNAENELPADTEQCPPRVLAMGLDHSDFLAAMAPKPVIILTQEKDFFDVRGGIEAFERLKKLYTLLGKPENIVLQVGPDPHGYTQPNRVAMYRFFNQVVGFPDTKNEPEITLEKDEALWCAPKGQVAELKSRTLMSFTKAASQALGAKRAKLRGEPLKLALRDLLKMPDPSKAPPDYRILRSAGTRKYPTKSYCQYVVETEPRIQTSLIRLSDEALTSRLQAENRPAVLYVSHHSADAELRDEPLNQELRASHPDAILYACDVRGIGDSQPNTCGAEQFLKPYGNHYFYAAHGIMLDRPLLGQRTFDVLRVLHLLAAAGHRKIHLVGKGWGALPAAFAGLLNGDVRQVTLKHALRSFAEVAEDADQQWPYAIMLPEVLKHFDLPDCYAELESKGLKSIEPWGAKDGMG